MMIEGAAAMPAGYVWAVGALSTMPDPAAGFVRDPAGLFRSAPQNLHLTATSRICSPQNGQDFVARCATADATLPGEGEVNSGASGFAAEVPHLGQNCAASSNVVPHLEHFISTLLDEALSASG